MMRSKMRSPRNETHCKARNNAMIRCLPMLVLVAALACAARTRTQAMLNFRIGDPPADAIALCADFAPIATFP